MPPLRILHLEDEPLDSELTLELLRSDGLDVEMDRVDTLAAFEKCLNDHYSLILSDYALPGVDALQALRLARQRRPDLPFIVLSGTLGEDIAIETLKLGATDYVIKQRMNRLPSAIRRALQEAEDQARRKKAEQESRMFRFFSENANDAHLLFNYETRILYANKLACERLGYTEEELLQLSASDIDPSFPKERVHALFEQLQQGRVPPFETIHKRKDQSTFPVEVTCAALELNGELLMFATSRDITERKRHEAELARANEELEQKVQARTAELRDSMADWESFSYSLSHDLRAPLRTIQNFTQFVLEDSGDKIGAEGTEFLQKVTSSARRMDRLIQDVLAFTRLSRREVELEKVEIEKLIHGIIQERPELQTPQAEIEIQSPLLPALGHEAFLTQCITNLLGNAVKFVSPGTKAKVRIWSEPIGEQVRFWFEDNGIGIDQEALHRLFQVFSRVHSGNAYEGTGIGLAIVRKAVERMGGRVGVESMPGKGSRFWLELPAAG